MPVAYFDAHCDTLTAVLENGGGLFENRFHVDFRRLAAYAPCAQVFAIWNGRYEEKVALLRRGSLPLGRRSPRGELGGENSGAAVRGGRREPGVRHRTPA